MAIQTVDNKYGVAKWIVDPVLGRGTHQTITAAIASAAAGDDIFIRPGTAGLYTENPTVTPGINLIGFTGDGDTPNVTIVGKITMSGAGTSTISNIRLQTNSDFSVVVSGSAASILNFNNCYFNCPSGATGNTAISFTSSSASSQITLTNCKGDLGKTGIAVFASSSAGILSILNSFLSNSGSSTTTNTISAGTLRISFSIISNPTTSSGTSAVGTVVGGVFDCTLINTTALTIGGSGVQSFVNSYINGGSASAISISSSLSIFESTIGSSNTNAITGAGTLIYSNLTFSNTSNTINTTTITRAVMDGGEYKGRNISTAPSAGMIGEQIRATVASGSSISLSTTVAANVTSISLTAGIWDVSSVGTFNGTPTGFSALNSSISTTTATLGTGGDNNFQSSVAPTGGANLTVSIPAFRISISATTTVFLVASGVFTGGTLGAYGRISATRVS